MTGDLGLLWKEFEAFTPSTTVFGLARESELALGSTWYEMGHLKQFYGSTGVNAGIALISIENWPRWLDERIQELVSGELRRLWILGDQDIINWILADRPEIVHIIPCTWNLRTDSHCRPEDLQRTILHGNRGIMHRRSPRGTRRMYYDYNQFARALVETDERVGSMIQRRQRVGAPRTKRREGGGKGRGLQEEQRTTRLRRRDREGGQTAEGEGGRRPSTVAGKERSV